jgi:hypothetical protein
VKPLIIALLAAVPLLGLLLVAGCELSGSYTDDNTRIEFGNTNSTAQTQTQ